MFVIVFGQLTLVLFFPLANTYGSISSFVVALVLRLLCGEKNMGIPSTISFGTIYGEAGSCPTEADPDHACEGPVPFRTIVTAIGIVSLTYTIRPLIIHTLYLQLVHLSVSSLTHFLFTREAVPLDLDFLECYTYDHHGKVIQARSRLMRHQQEEYQMETRDLKIPRPKVRISSK